MALLPVRAELRSASLSFTIPGDRRLGGSALARITTSAERAETIVRLSVSDVLLRVVFEPALVIKLPPPLSDLALQSVAYDLGTGAITSRLWHTSSLALHVGEGAAEGGAKAWMRDLVTSTPLAIPPYDPEADPEILSTVAVLLANLGGQTPIAPHEIRGVGATIKVSFPEELRGEGCGGGFRVPAGADAAVSVELAGSLVEIEAAPRIRAIHVESAQVILQKDGVDQAAVKRLTIRPGGEIDVVEVAALGEAGAAAGVESLLSLVMALSSGSYAAGAPQLDAGGVESLVKSEIRAVLEPALRALVEAHRDAIPGLDLGEIMGIS